MIILMRRILAPNITFPLDSEDQAKPYFLEPENPMNKGYFKVKH